MEHTIETDYGLKFLVDYDAMRHPKEGDGWNDPVIPAHWEIEINSVFQLDDHDEPCGHALELTKEFVDVMHEELEDVCDDYRNESIGEKRYEQRKANERFWS